MRLGLSSLRALSRDARLYLLSNLMQALAVGVIALLYPLFITRLGFDAQVIGNLAVIGTLGGALGLVPAGALLDRVGWRAMLLASNALGGAAILMQLLAPIVPVLYITTFVVGISVALTIVVNAPLLAGASDAGARTLTFSVNYALNFLAAIAGTLLGGLLPDGLRLPAVRDSAPLVALRPLLVADPTARAYQLALLVAGLLAIPSLIPILMMRERRLPAPPQVAPAPARPLRERLGQLLTRVRREARGPIGRFTVSQSLIGLGAGCFFPFLGIYMVNRGLSTSAFGALSSVQTALLAGAALVGAPLAARFGKVRLAIVAQTCSLPFMLLLGASPWLVVAAAAFLIRAALMNVGSPGLQAAYMESVPAAERGLASSVYNGVYQGAWALGALLGGSLIHLAGYPALFYCAAALYAASIILLAWWFPWRSRTVSAAFGAFQRTPSGADPAQG